MPKFRITSLPEKESAKINSKKAQKEFMEFITKGSTEKIVKALAKGFDPNFVAETGGMITYTC